MQFFSVFILEIIFCFENTDLDWFLFWNIQNHENFTKGCNRAFARNGTNIAPSTVMFQCFFLCLKVYLVFCLLICVNILKTLSTQYNSGKKQIDTQAGKSSDDWVERKWLKITCLWKESCDYFPCESMNQFYPLKATFWYATVTAHTLCIFIKNKWLLTCSGPII